MMNFYKSNIQDPDIEDDQPETQILSDDIQPNVPQLSFDESNHNYNAYNGIIDTVVDISLGEIISKEKFVELCTTTDASKAFIYDDSLGRVVGVFLKDDKYDKNKKSKNVKYVSTYSRLYDDKNNEGVVVIATYTPKNRNDLRILIEKKTHRVLFIELANKIVRTHNGIHNLDNISDLIDSNNNIEQTTPYGVYEFAYYTPNGEQAKNYFFKSGGNPEKLGMMTIAYADSEIWPQSLIVKKLIEKSKGKGIGTQSIMKICTDMFNGSL